MRWTVVPDLEPAWDVAMAYQIEIRGYPQVNVRAEVLPADMESMSLDDMLAIGSVITAMPVVNAIAGVVAAPPGIVTYKDLPPQASPLVVDVSGEQQDHDCSRKHDIRRCRMSRIIGYLPVQGFATGLSPLRSPYVTVALSDEQAR